MRDPNTITEGVRQDDHPVAPQAEQTCLRCGYTGIFNDAECNWLENEMPDVARFLDAPDVGKIVAAAFRNAIRCKCDAMRLLIDWSIAKPERQPDGKTLYILPEDVVFRPAKMVETEEAIIELATLTAGKPDNSRQAFIDQLTTMTEDYKARAFDYFAKLLKSVIPQVEIDPNKKPA